MTEKNLDIVMYGATGFTGGLCVKYLKENHPGTKIAIGGRNKKKLQQSFYNLDFPLVRLLK